MSFVAISADQAYLDPENENGNIEYKYTLLDQSENILESRASQLNYRLQEGNGLATIYIGVTDNGYQLGLVDLALKRSISNLEKIIEKIDTRVLSTEIFETTLPIETSYKQLFLSYNSPVSEKEETSTWKARPIIDNDALNQKRYVAKINLSKNTSFNRETRIVVLGNVDAGKSTLLGVLTKNLLDNGNGSARATVFNHPHEIQTGRTSSISQQLLGLNAAGQIVNTLRSTYVDLVQQSSHVVSLYDCAGHLKYLNTAVRGVCGHYPDHALIVVGGNMGITDMTKEHILLAYLNKVSMTIVITKTDIAPEQKLSNTIGVIKNLLKSVNYQTLVIKSEGELDIYRKQTSKQLVPIILVSNVKGTGLPLLTSLIHNLPKKNDFAKRIMEPFYFSINETFSVPGVGTVISGLVIAGMASSKGTHWIGPFSDGKFKKVHFRSIQNKRVNVDECQADQTVTVAIRGIEKREILKGMVIIDGKQPEPVGKTKYQAQLTIIGKHSTSIKEFYEPIINIANIRQAARITAISNVKRGTRPMTDREAKELQRLDGKDVICMRSGDTATIEMEFCFRPTHVLPGSLLMFREQKVKGYGYILP